MNSCRFGPKGRKSRSDKVGRLGAYFSSTRRTQEMSLSPLGSFAPSAHAKAQAGFKFNRNGGSAHGDHPR
jgi:hypothetical protein